MKSGLRTRLKICGITRLEDLELSASCGADAIGMVLYSRSKRAVSIEQVAQLCRACPAFIDKVAVLVNPETDFVTKLLQETGISVLQFHGNEDAAFCRQFGIPYIKAVGVDESVDIAGLCATYDDAVAILADTADPVNYGGTGKVFDWSALPESVSRPLILAGGLTPVNVAAAIGQIRPWAVDVSGGVEAAPGIKDPQLLKAFAAEVHAIAANS